MRQAPPKSESLEPVEFVFPKRILLRVRLRGRLLTWLVMLAEFIVVVISTGAYRSTRGVITIAIAFIIVSIASAAVFWLIGQFEPAIAPLTISGYDLKYLRSEVDGCTVCSECCWRRSGSDPSRVRSVE